MIRTKLLTLSPLLAVFTAVQYSHYSARGQAAPAADKPWWELALFGAAAALSVGISWYQARSRLQATNAILLAAVEIDEGTPGAALNTDGSGEFEALVAAFNTLAASLLKSRQAQRTASQNFQRIFEALPVPASLYSGDLGGLVQVNEAFCRYYSLSREQLLGRTLDDFDLGLPAAARPLFRTPLDQRGQVYNLEVPVRVPGGTLRQVLTSAEVLDLQNQRHILSIQVDVTDRVQAERALQERKQQLTGIVDSALDGIVTVDAKGRIVVFNEAAGRMFGVRPDDALGSSPERFLPLELRVLYRQEFARVCQADLGLAARRLPHHIEGLHAEGTRFPMDVAMSSAGAGEHRTYTVVLRDLTEQEFAEAALLESARAIAANQAKTAFLSRMSHELRTPLNAVLGFAQLLRESARQQLNPGQQRQLELICAAGNQLTALIDDVLDLSRIEAGGLALNPQRIVLAEALQDISQMFDAQSTATGVSIRAIGSADGALAVTADPLRLQQVLMNLVSNALKYNHENGEVRFAALREGNTVALSVEDTGHGMSEEQLAHAFEPFNRLGRELGPIPGTGIGLALCRQLVELMGGDIDIISHPGVGTRVTMRLPAADTDQQQATELSAPAASPAPPAEPSSTDLQGTIVYVEDVAMNAALVQALVAPWKGVQLVVAETGVQGVSRIRELKPDLVLLDMHLPDISGLDVLAQLRADDAARDTPVVVLSADAMPVDVDAARKAGADDYWTKPIDFRIFREGLQRWLSR